MGKKDKHKKKVKHRAKRNKKVSYYSVTEKAEQIERLTQRPQARESLILDAELVQQDRNFDVLDACRELWQKGDWQNLSKIEMVDIQRHPERAKLALLAAAGSLQMNDRDTARKRVDLAQRWGCNPNLIKRVLISCVYNSLGRANAIARKPGRSNRYFERALQLIVTTGQLEHLTSLRINTQLKQIIENSQYSLPGQIEDYLHYQISSSANCFAMPYNESTSRDEDRKGTSYLRERDPASTLDTGRGAEYTSDAKMEGPQTQALPETTYEPTHPKACFRLPVFGLAAEPINLAFNTLHSEAIHMEGQTLEIVTDSGAPLYMVSNESGNFDQAPNAQQLFLKPNTPYHLSGNVEYQGDTGPIVWLFQYADGKKISSKSLPVHDGKISHHFWTAPNLDAFALGIRVAGKGALSLAKSRFQLALLTVQEMAVFQEERIAQLESAQQSQQSQQRNQLQQLEAFTSLQLYLGSEVLLPKMHGWAISPDFGLLLVKLVEQNDFQAIIEFGSGTSTLVLARATQRSGSTRSSSTSQILSFDHLIEYQETTKSLINRAGLGEVAQVIHAPLALWHDASGEGYSYYQCEDALQTLKVKLGSVLSRILIVVDGPPADTGKHARYPALSNVLQTLGTNHYYQVLMDDYIRTDEQEVLVRWQRDLQAQQLPTRVTEFNSLEKRACLLEINPALANESA